MVDLRPEHCDLISLVAPSMLSELSEQPSPGSVKKNTPTRMIGEAKGNTHIDADSFERVPATNTSEDFFTCDIAYQDYEQLH